MANVNEIKKNTVNSAEIEKSTTDKQAETNNKPTELINNALETSEDTNEINKETKIKEDKAHGKVIISYIGSGIWKDSKGKLWASQNKSDNILSERQYSADEYKDREDIKFMIKYGAMKETYVK